MPPKLIVIILNYLDFKTTNQSPGSLIDQLNATTIFVDDKENITPINLDKTIGIAAEANLGLNIEINNKFSQFLLLNHDASLPNGSSPVMSNAFTSRPSALIASIIIYNQIHHGCIISCLSPAYKSMTITH